MRTSHVSRTAVGAVALLLAVFVTACEEDAPSPSPAPSSSATESESTSNEPTATPTWPVEPTLPIVAQAETEDGVTAFVAYYFDAINYATATGDVQLLSTLDQRSCVGCQGGIDFVQRVYRRGGRIVGGAYRVVRLDPARSPSGHWTITAYTRINDQRVVGAGELNTTYPGGRAKWRVGVSRVGTGWSITTLDIL